MNDPAPRTLNRVELRQALGQAGLRFTRQRAEVYDYLAQADHHPTADDVFAAVKPLIPNLSLATVYKALDALTASGLAEKLTGEGGSARYDARPDRHYHLRCVRTGRVEDLETHFDPDLVRKLDPELEADLRARGFHLTGYRLELVGYYDGDRAPRS